MKRFWVYIASNRRLRRWERADRLGDAGVALFNFAVGPSVFWTNCR